MQTKTVVLRDVIQTVTEMDRLSKQYLKDLIPYAGLNLIQFYYLLKNIPFKSDPKDNEFLQRPAATLYGLSKYGDCDDKSIVLKSFCFLKNIPARFCAVSNFFHRRLHHIYIEVLLCDEWKPLDPTYHSNKLFKERPFTKKVVFS